MLETAASLGEFWVALVAVVALLVVSAYFSAAETALTGASRPRMHQLAQDGDRRAAVVRHLQEQREMTIGALLLGNNLANICSSALATFVLIAVFGEAGVAYATVVMTALVLVFAEVMPKTYSLNHADAVSLALARPTRLVVAALTPMVVTVRWIVRATLKACGASLPDYHRIGTTEEELRGVIDLHAGPEPDVRHERAMLMGVLDLDEVTVEKVMTHRKNLATVDADEPAKAIIDAVLASGHTHVPLTRGAADNIVGVIETAALVRAVIAAGAAAEGLDVVGMAEKPWYVPDSTTLFDQLQSFRQRGGGLALVVDEYGALKGAVTLQDILAEIVGQMGDNAPPVPGSPLPGVQRQADGAYVIDGSVSIRDLNRELDWALPDQDAATIAGLVLHEARMIPSVGQVFEFHGFRFEILRRQRNQVTSIRVTPPKPQPE
ncbi:MAG: HlyC/CorC family transporter [Rhodospirillales bacterium]